MVGDDHDVADLECRVHATCGIAYEEGADAECFHYAHGESHLFHVISLVVMETTLHSHHAFAAESAENQVSAVALYCRQREVGYVGVGDELFVFDMIHKSAETGAEDYGRFGHFAFHARTYVVGCLSDLF
ncbi:hypothetical protein IMSAGC006_01259 [Muribaculaceae bacterium]|nr:hypothetical protein IMSAGC006_01259 [Muribaculaceae bacterium]